MRLDELELGIDIITLQYRLTPLSMPERPVFANDNEADPPDVT